METELTSRVLRLTLLQTARTVLPLLGRPLTTH
jgi:hypothetical protein